MSTAIAMPSASIFWKEDYQPVSEASRNVQREWKRNKNILRSSASDWSPTVTAALLDVANECSVPGWDGDNAVAISGRTIELTAQVIDVLFALLPRGTPPPEVVPESDGEICMSWTLDDSRTFALSIGEHRKFNFAGQFGEEGAIHGWQPIHATNEATLAQTLWGVAKNIAKLFAQPLIRPAA